VNFRILIFSTVFLILIGTPVYVFVKASVTGGIETVGDLKEVDLKAMGNFPFDDVNGTVNDIPQRYRELDGKTVLLKGQVFADAEAGDRMTRFQLVYSIMECCFQGPPKVQERVFVEVPRGMTVPNLNGRYASVRGSLRIDLNRQEGRATQLYVLEAEELRPL
jgi:hypothetical protein